MSFKEVFDKEVKDLKKVKRPYETAAFLLFAILLGQQLIFLFKALIELIFNINNVSFLSTTGWCTSNLMGFVSRIVFIDSSNWFYIIMGVLAYFLYYFLIYIFVWNYAKKHNLAKWTWTVFIVFGPTLILIPPYIFFVVYAYRSYFVRFAKKLSSEFKDYNPEQPLPEDLPEPDEPVKEPENPEPEKPNQE